MSTPAYRFDSASFTVEASTDGKVHFKIVTGHEVRVGFEMDPDSAEGIAEAIRERAELARRLAQ